MQANQELPYPANREDVLEFPLYYQRFYVSYI